MNTKEQIVPNVFVLLESPGRTLPQQLMLLMRKLNALTEDCVIEKLVCLLFIYLCI